jgi:hypothetical protein
MWRREVWYKRRHVSETAFVFTVDPAYKASHVSRANVAPLFTVLAFRHYGRTDKSKNVPGMLLCGSQYPRQDIMGARGSGARNHMFKGDWCAVVTTAEWRRMNCNGLNYCWSERDWQGNDYDWLAESLVLPQEEDGIPLLRWEGDC